MTARGLGCGLPVSTMGGARSEKTPHPGVVSGGRRLSVKSLRKDLNFIYGNMEDDYSQGRQLSALKTLEKTGSS